MPNNRLLIRSFPSATCYIIQFFFFRWPKTHTHTHTLTIICYFYNFNFCCFLLLHFFHFALLLKVFFTTFFDCVCVCSIVILWMAREPLKIQQLETRQLKFVPPRLSSRYQMLSKKWNARKHDFSQRLFWFIKWDLRQLLRSAITSRRLQAIITGFLPFNTT